MKLSRRKVLNIIIYIIIAISIYMPVRFGIMFGVYMFLWSILLSTSMIMAMSIVNRNYSVKERGFNIYKLLDSIKISEVTSINSIYFLLCFIMAMAINSGMWGFLSSCIIGIYELIENNGGL